MRILLQRVSEARVEMDGNVVGRISTGFLLLVGVGHRDTASDREWLARKIAGLRVFPDESGKMNRSLAELGGACLAVSQFTLYGDCSKGFRPGFTEAAPAEKGRAEFEAFVEALRSQGTPVETGVFQAEMRVHLVNEGPVTLWLERESGT